MNSYKISKKIGSGTYGHVYRGESKSTGEFFAIKQIPKTKIKRFEHLEAEVSILSETDHPNIIKLVDKFEDPRNLYIVMEECKGGELFDLLTS